MRSIFNGAYVILCLLRSFLYPLSRVLGGGFSWYRARVDFEKKNLSDIFSKSFSSENIKADVAFEVSSEGELEQIRPVLLRALNDKLHVELIYASDSVEKKCAQLASRHSMNLRILRLPLILYSLIPWRGSQNPIQWITAEKLIMCRYDFYPELMLYGSKKNISFVLLSATTKNKNIRSYRYFYRTFFSYFDQIVTATEKDQWELTSLSSDPQNICTLDFRVIQIKKRLDDATKNLAQMDFFNHYLQYLNVFEKKNRLLVGSAWPVEMDMFSDQEFLKKILSGEISVAIAPHKLAKEFIESIVARIRSFSTAHHLDLPIYILNKDLSKNDMADFFDRMMKNPGVLVNCLPGILCELYSFFGNVYVGGGFTRSIHSVLEPYLAMANIYCGPLIHRSTEYDFVKLHSPGLISVVEKSTHFFAVFMSHYQDEIDIQKRSDLMRLFELNFEQVYAKIVSKRG